MALKQLTTDALAKGLQVSEQNPLSGLEGRCSLLLNLGTALDNQELFGVDSRPGNMLGLPSLAVSVGLPLTVSQTICCNTHRHSESMVTLLSRFLRYGISSWTA